MFQLPDLGEPLYTSSPIQSHPKDDQSSPGISAGASSGISVGTSAGTSGISAGTSSGISASSGFSPVGTSSSQQYDHWAAYRGPIEPFLIKKEEDDVIIISSDEEDNSNKANKAKKIKKEAQDGRKMIDLGSEDSDENLSDRDRHRKNEKKFSKILNYIEKQIQIREEKKKEKGKK